MNIVQRALRQALRPRGGRLLILAYGRIGGEDSTSARRSEFTWQMEQIVARVKPIVLSRLMGHLGGKKPLTGPQVCVCFCADHDAQFVQAVTRELGIGATWFIPFDRISDGEHPDANPPVWDWASVGELVASGSEIGHRVVGDAVTDSTHRRTSLSTLRCRVEQSTGMRVHSIAFPAPSSRGQEALIYDAAIAGFNLGVEPAPGVNSLGALSPMMLRSETIAPNLDRDRFRALLDSLGPA
jgi:hypothetical protein